MLFYPDGKRSTSDPNAPSAADDPYAALFVALIGEGPRPQGVVTSVNGRVVRAFHRFTLVDQLENGNRHITKGRQRDQGAVKISCARQDPNARNCHGYRKFVRRSVLESPNNGYLKDDTIVIRYEIELVVTSGGALNRPKQLAPTIDVSTFPTLGDQIKTLLTDDAEKTDVVFEVEGDRFPAHSLVVAARSSAFRAMLRTGAEMREGSEGVIRIGDVRAPVFRVLLQFLYSDELPDGTGRNTSHEFAVRRGEGEHDTSAFPPGGNGVGRIGNGAASRGVALTGVPSSSIPDGTDRDRVFGNRGGSGNDTPELDVAMTQHLLVAADRFDLTRLRAMCEAKLCDTVEVETAATTLALAEQNNALALKQACLQFVASHLGEVMLTEGYKHMEESCPNLAGELLKTVAQQNQAKAAAEAANAGALSAPAAQAAANADADLTAIQNNVMAMQAATAVTAAAATSALPVNEPAPTQVANRSRRSRSRSPPVPTGRVRGPRMQFRTRPLSTSPSPERPYMVEAIRAPPDGFRSMIPADPGQEDAPDVDSDEDLDEDDNIEDPLGASGAVADAALGALGAVADATQPTALDARHPARRSRAWVAPPNPTRAAQVPDPNLPASSNAGGVGAAEVTRGRGRAVPAAETVAPATRGVATTRESPARRGVTTSSPSIEDGANGSGRRVRRRTGGT